MRKVVSEYIVGIHNMQQAALSDVTAMMMLTADRRSGTVIEVGDTRTIFEAAGQAHGRLCDKWCG